MKKEMEPSGIAQAWNTKADPFEALPSRFEVGRREFIQLSALAVGGIWVAPNNMAAGEVGLPTREATRHACPRSQTPARNTAAVRLQDLFTFGWDMRLTLTCLQGIVNRRQPQLYLIHDRYDELWLDWMRKRGDVDTVEWLSMTQVFDRFLSQVSCMFVTDPSLPASINVATMLAGVYGGLVATPNTFQQVNLSAGSGTGPLKNGLDLQKMHWKKDLEAYRWAFHTLDSHLSRQAIAILDPTEIAFRDYLVEFNLPTFWISGTQDVAKNPAAAPEEEKDFAREVMMQWPPNIPCMGWPSGGYKESGIGEDPGIRLASECAKFEVCTAFDGYSPTVGNLSVHSGTSATLSQAIPPVKLQPDKVYCAFIRSDGDGMNFVRHYYRQLFDDPRHGEVPLGWQLGTMVSDLMPDIADYYYKHARPGDCFVNALTGAGYIWEEWYAKGYPVEQRQKILRNYQQLSAQYRQRIDASVMSTGNEMPPDLLKLFASEKGIRGIFANYVRSQETTRHNLVSEVAGVPVFRDAMGLVSWLSGDMDFTAYSQKETVRRVIAEIKQWTPAYRPAFLFVGVNNWLREIGMLTEIVNGLGPEYAAVRPDQLVDLYISR
jgi:hypothetical protein